MHAHRLAVVGLVEPRVAVRRVDAVRRVVVAHAKVVRGGGVISEARSKAKARTVNPMMALPITVRILWKSTPHLDDIDAVNALDVYAQHIDSEFRQELHASRRKDHEVIDGVGS